MDVIVIIILSFLATFANFSTCLISLSRRRSITFALFSGLALFIAVIFIDVMTGFFSKNRFIGGILSLPLYLLIFRGSFFKNIFIIITQITFTTILTLFIYALSNLFMPFGEFWYYFSMLLMGLIIFPAYVLVVWKFGRHIINILYSFGQAKEWILYSLSIGIYFYILLMTVNKLLPLNPEIAYQIISFILLCIVVLCFAIVNTHEKTREKYKAEIQRLELQAKVYYDKLTGIYNRHYLDEKLDPLMKMLSRSGGNISILMMDLDFFKKYNDTYGHKQGDECLKAVAKALSDSLLREDDFVARFGGEEFIAVLPNTDENGATLIANKILNNIRELKLPHEKNEVADYVTISIGITSGKVLYNQNAEDYIKQADKALYISKENRRNKYTYLGMEC